MNNTHLILMKTCSHREDIHHEHNFKQIITKTQQQQTLNLDNFEQRT